MVPCPSSARENGQASLVVFGAVGQIQGKPMTEDEIVYFTENTEWLRKSRLLGRGFYSAIRMTNMKDIQPFLKHSKRGKNFCPYNEHIRNVLKE